MADSACLLQLMVALGALEILSRQQDASKNWLFLITNRPLLGWGDGGGSRMAGQPGFFDGDERLKAL
ncbi:MAG: hypothetical protein WB646_02100, partial [Steroidobacteraceae bacterium]